MLSSRRRRDRAIKRRRRRQRGPRARLSRRLRDVFISVAAVAPTPRSRRDRRARIFRIRGVFARGRRAATTGSGTGAGRGGAAGCGGAGIRYAAPGGKVVNAALVVERGVRSEVVLYGLLAVADGLELRADVIDDAALAEEAAFGPREVFLHARAEEAIVCCCAREVFPGEVATDGALLEAVDAVRDALEVVEDGDLAREGGHLGAFGEDGLGDGGPGRVGDGGR